MRGAQPAIAILIIDQGVNMQNFETLLLLFCQTDQELSDRLPVHHCAEEGELPQGVTQLN